MTQATINGITIEYDVQGPEKGEPVLLIMGLGAQMTRWPQELRQKLADRGFRVIRFDNRDCGLSQKFQGAPRLDEVVAALMAGKKPDIPYTLDDMAEDAAGVLDHLAIKKAHIVGASMGGMIAQVLVAKHPGRALSLTAIFTSTGNPSLPRATPEAFAVISTRAPDPKTDIEGYLDQMVKNARTIGSPGFAFDEKGVRERALSDVQRCYEPLGVARQMAAITANGDRRERIKTIGVPTVVLHGDADPLVPVEGVRDVAANIKGAELRIVPGMGHDIPVALYDTVVDAIARAAERARALA
ncbi:MAG: alpha/beta hydrolase [Terricaulis sp.]